MSDLATSYAGGPRVRVPYVRRPVGRGRYLASAPRSAWELPRLSAGAAYGRAVGLIAVLFGPRLAGDVLLAFGVHEPWWMSGWWGFGPSMIFAAVWVASIGWCDSRLVRPFGVTAGVLIFGAVVPALVGVSGDVAGLVEVAGLLTAAWALIPAVCLGVGIDPRDQLGVWPRWAANPAGRRQAVAVFVVALAGFAAARVLLIVLSAIDWLPQMTGTQRETLGITSQLDLWVNATTAGPREEVILLAAPLVFLAAARRPTWEICLLAVAARILIHLYFQTPALAAAVFALVNVALWLRCRRLVPLAAAHTTFNIVVGLGVAGPVAMSALGICAWPAFVIALGWRLAVRRRPAPHTAQ